MSSKSLKVPPLTPHDAFTLMWSLCSWHHMMGLHWLPRYDFAKKIDNHSNYNTNRSRELNVISPTVDSLTAGKLPLQSDTLKSISETSVAVGNNTISDAMEDEFIFHEGEEPLKVYSISGKKRLKVSPKPEDNYQSTVQIAKEQTEKTINWDDGVVDENLEEALRDLKKSYDDLDSRDLKAMANSTVFSDGNPRAKVMLVGEAPGADEDRQGIPFVGASGQLLDKMLASIGLDRHHVYITNVIPWRPPGNRPPTPHEIQMFKPFLIRHLSLIRPRYLVLLGATACKTLCGARSPMARWRGRWFTLPDVPWGMSVRVFFHPSYLLRSPYQKREAWKDFLALQDMVKPVNPSFQAILG